MPCVALPFGLLPALRWPVGTLAVGTLAPRGGWSLLALVTFGAGWCRKPARTTRHDPTPGAGQCRERQSSIFENVDRISRSRTKKYRPITRLHFENIFLLDRCESTFEHCPAPVRKRSVVRFSNRPVSGRGATAATRGRCVAGAAGSARRGWDRNAGAGPSGKIPKIKMRAPSGRFPAKTSARERVPPFKRPRDKNFGGPVLLARWWCPVRGPLQNRSDRCRHHGHGRAAVIMVASVIAVAAMPRRAALL
jgi:hypothetical protein